MKIRTILLFGLILLHAGTRADRIVLTDGRVIEGTIDAATTATQQADPQLTLSTASGKITLRRSQIQSIAESTPREKLLLDARDWYRIGRYEDAALGFDRLLQSGFPAETVADLLLNEKDPQPRRLREMNEAGRAAMGRVLGAIAPAAAAMEAEARMRLVRLHLMNGDDDRARALIQEYGTEFFDAHPRAHQDLIDWLNGQMQGDLYASDFAAGAARLETLRQLDPRQSNDSHVHFYLQWGRQLRDKGEFAGALDVYHTYLLKSYPKIAEEFIRRTLNEAELTFGQRGDDQATIRLYETYGMDTMGEEATDRIVGLWHNIGWRAMRRGDFIDAREAFDAEDRARPGAGRQDLLQLEFRQKAATIEDTDLLGQYELGVWAHDQELWGDAVARFNKALASPVVGANAQAYIDRIMNQQAEVELKRLMEMYRRQEYREVLENLHHFEQAGYAPGYQAQARRIGDLTLEAMRMAVAERPQQAAALLQQAERDFYQDRYPEASAKLQTIVNQFKDTIVFPKAMALLARVREREAMSALEARAAPPAPPALIENASTSVTITAPALPDMLNPPPPPELAPEGEDLESFYRSLGGQKTQ